MSGEETRRAYDLVARDDARLLPGLSAETRLDVAMIDDFAERCRAGALGPVADIGCGPGRITARLAEHGLDVVGIDVSAVMVDVARELHPALRFEVAAMEKLFVPDASFGGVLAWYSLIHTEPARLPSVVSQLARVLMPGGWLLAAFQCGDDERVDRTRAYGHEVQLTNYLHAVPHMAAVLEAEGFAIRAELHRGAEGAERTPQAVVLARRSVSGYQPRGTTA